MPDLTWTREPPTEPGWYWVRNYTMRREGIGRTSASGPSVTWVRETEMAGTVAFTDIGKALTREMTGFNGFPCEWAGPIPAPREPGGE